MATKTHLVDTVADLTSTTENPKADLIEGQQITVAGYYAAGDKEAVTYVWNAASTATANGGTILAHDDGGTGRFLLEKETVSVKDFGAVGDGVTDDHAAIQAAWTFAENSRTPLLFPGRADGDSIWAVSEPIVWAKTINVRMDSNKSSSNYIKPTASMTAVISGSTDTGDTDDYSRSSFYQVFIYDGNDYAQYGWRGVTNHTDWESCRVSGLAAGGYGIQTGYGWCNTFHKNELSFLKGGGLDLSLGGGQSNSNTIQDNRIFANAGIGLLVVGSYGVKIIGNTVETNKVCGIYVNYCVGLTIDTNYFESNTETGFAFTSPASVTIKADVILNGAGTLTTIAAATGTSASVVGNFFSPNASYSQDCLIFAPGAHLLDVGNNQVNASFATTIAEVQYYGSATVSPSYGQPLRLSMTHSSAKATPRVTVTPITAGLVDYSQSQESRIIGVEGRNYCPTIRLEQWTSQGIGTGGTWLRSSATFDRDPAVPVWEINHTASSVVYGFSVNFNNYPHLIDKIMLFSCWVQQTSSDSTGNVHVYANSVSNSSSYSSNTAWQFMSLAFVASAATKVFGVRWASATTGSARIATASLNLFGADIFASHAAFRQRQDFVGTAAPTVGTWKLYDRVWNTAPAAAGVPGWVCTTAGTPGTWNAMAALAA